MRDNRGRDTRFREARARSCENETFTRPSFPRWLESRLQAIRPISRPMLLRKRPTRKEGPTLLSTPPCRRTSMRRPAPKGSRAKRNRRHAPSVPVTAPDVAGRSPGPVACFPKEAAFPASAASRRLSGRSRSDAASVASGIEHTPARLRKRGSAGHGPHRCCPKASAIRLDASFVLLPSHRFHDDPKTPRRPSSGWIDARFPCGTNTWFHP